MRAYYNEIDRYCCDWLQNLMDAGLITPGKIDDRSIADLSPDDVRGYERCHFFAGIAGWELALSLSEYRGPVWTGSCPCQPFSAAGKGKASSDERHLWPIWFELIRAVRPAGIFGEQVEAAIGWGWLDLVHSDLEPEGYTIRSSVLPACSVGAPHIRQRLWFVGNASGEPSEAGESADAEPQHNGRRNAGPRRRAKSANSGHWSDLIWLPCSDGKRRPTGLLGHANRAQADSAEPGQSLSGAGRSDLGANTGESGQDCGPTQSIIQPLAHGVSGRVAKLRAAGNAIVPQVAAEFIKAAMQ